MKPSCHFFLHVIQDWLHQLDDQQHSTASESRSGKKEPAIKDKTASAKMPNVGLTVFVFDAEQTIRLLLTSSENDNFIKVNLKEWEARNEVTGETSSTGEVAWSWGRENI